MWLALLESNDSMEVYSAVYIFVFFNLFWIKNCFRIVLTHTTFVKFGLVISHHCKEFNSWSHTTELWEQLYTKLCRSFDIVHHIAHLISSFQEICSLVTNLSTFVTIFLSLRFKHYFDIVWGWKFTSGNCFAFIVNAYGKQIICSIWYSKFDV